MKLQYGQLSFEGWEKLTTSQTTIKNDGKTGKNTSPKPELLAKRFWWSSADAPPAADVCSTLLFTMKEKR